MMKRLSILIRAIWSAARALSGDDAYERYLVHWRARHAGATPLDRKGFYDGLQQRKWNGVRRCC